MALKCYPWLGGVYKLIPPLADLHCVAVLLFRIIAGVNERCDPLLIEVLRKEWYGLSRFSKDDSAYLLLRLYSPCLTDIEIITEIERRFNVKLDMKLETLSDIERLIKRY